jgi:mono/diheme cytochrome c family protein
MRRAIIAAVFASCVVFAGIAAAQEGASGGRGKEVFDYWCAACHGSGPGKPGTGALQALYNDQKPALLEERTDLTPELTKSFVRTGVSIMPFFRKTEISDADLDALAAYLAP